MSNGFGKRSEVKACQVCGAKGKTILLNDITISLHSRLQRTLVIKRGEPGIELSQSNPLK